jgi:hypothetical protein
MDGDVFMLNDVDFEAEERHSASIKRASSTAQMLLSQETKENESPFVEEASNAIDENQATTSPLKKKLKRPSRADPQEEARNTALSVLKEQRVQKKARRRRCAPVDGLELAEERFCSEDVSDCK